MGALTEDGSRGLGDSMLRRSLLRMIRAAILAGVAIHVAGLASAAGSLPVPRFASLRSDKIYLRAGPGLEFPVQWVYQRKHMPVEVIGEYDVWRKIRDWQGTVGWVHQSMLDGQRYALITGSERLLRVDPDDASAPSAKLEPGVVATLLRCQGVWCRLEADGYKGWVRRDEFYGIYPEEKLE